MVCLPFYSRTKDTLLCTAQEESPEGRCSEVDFAGYTEDMFVEWSSVCGAYWPCSNVDLDPLYEEAAVISEENTIDRIACGFQ